MAQMNHAPTVGRPALQNFLRDSLGARPRPRLRETKTLRGPDHEEEVETPPGYELPESFWKTFVESHWEQQPRKFAGLFETSIVSEDELFQAVLSKPERVKSDRFWATEVTTDGPTKYKQIPLEMFGPKATDESLTGFFDRTAKGFKDRKFGINIHHLQLASPELWFRSREFVHGLAEVTGQLPTQRWDIDTFFGTYEATPFGIHQDNASVFAFGIRGNRTYYAWPDEYFEKGDPALHNPDVQAIEPHLKHAIRMDIGPGDVAYWPSSHWHIVTSDGEPSAVVQVSAYFGTNLSDIVAQHVRKHLAKQLDQDFQKTFRLTDEQQHASAATDELSPELKDASDRLTGLVSDGVIQHSLKKYWLRLRSADGFDPVPAADGTASLESDAEFQVNPRFPIRWMEDGEQLRIAANGLVHTVADDPSIRHVVDVLNSGQPFTIDHLVETVAETSVDASSVQDFVEKLIRLRAVRLR